MFGSTSLLVTLFALLSLAPAQAQSLAEAAKKEKERRSKVEKMDQPARTIDESGLSEYHGPDEPDEPDENDGNEGASGGNASDAFPPVDSDGPERRPPAESPSRSRPASPPSSSSSGSASTATRPPRDPTLGPEYIEDHLYGEENLKRLRREASTCRVKERASSPRCKELEKKADALEKLLRERRKLH